MNIILVERAGISSSYQDMGRLNLQYIGIVQGGCIDEDNFLLCNAILQNNSNEGLIEFAYQGPKIKVVDGNCKVAITGDVIFNIIKSSGSVIKGECYRSYYLNQNDTLDILTTSNSVYGYLGFEGGIDLQKYFGSVAVNSRSNLGPNNGKKLSNNDKIQLKKNIYTSDEYILRRIPEKNRNTTIRVLEGPQEEYFSNNGLTTFYEKSFLVSNLTDRMGMRLEGSKIDLVESPNIKSEGIIKGSIQVPANGQPIILLSDHQTIGGYPKIAIIASADYDHLAQTLPGTSLKFKKINLREANISYQLKIKTRKNIIASLQKI